MSDGQRGFELSVPQILGSALAAVTAAVAASYLGVAGTVIGAAVVSVASTVATAIYTHYLKRTGERVKQHTLVPKGGRDPEQGLLAAAAHATRADADRETTPHAASNDEGAARHETPADGDTPDATSGDGRSTLVMPVVRGPGRGLPWAKVGVAAATVFAVSMGSILAYQALAERTVHEQVTGKAPVKAREDRTPATREPESRAPAYPPHTLTTEPETPTLTPTPTPTPSATRSRTPAGRPTSEPTPTRPEPVTPSQGTTEAPPQEQPEQPDGTDETPTATAEPSPQTGQDEADDHPAGRDDLR
ncbi:hypothetical protein AB0C28_12035 [Nonomuraea sp. NPDC048892]|uniref:hypothetical protein n=1 Tax=Nonomuraea sp. NPDC048892 TaxID=3154624 RepID=UPI0033DCA09D